MDDNFGENLIHVPEKLYKLASVWLTYFLVQRKTSALFFICLKINPKKGLKNKTTGLLFCG